MPVFWPLPPKLNPCTREHRDDRVLLVCPGSAARPFRAPRIVRSLGRAHGRHAPARTGRPGPRPAGTRSAGAANSTPSTTSSAAKIAMKRPLRPRMPTTRSRYRPLLRSKAPLNQRKKPDSPWCSPCFERRQHCRAQRRRQHDGDEHRQRHGRDDRHRELPVDDAGRAAEEGHRHEHRRQHEPDADQRAGDLVHRLACRLERRQPFFAHQALDVLDHDDGIVDQQADGEHHREHRQHVDREAERGEHAERARAAPPARRSSGSASRASSAGTGT